MIRNMTQSPYKLPPVHPGEILNEEFLRPMNVTQYRLAKAIGVDARRIHAIVHGEGAISGDGPAAFPLFRKLCEFLDGAAKPVRPGDRRGPTLPKGWTS